MRARLRTLLAALIGGALTGAASLAFLRSLSWATSTRIEHGWLVWWLPVAGLVVGAVYFYLGGRAKGGTPAVIEQGNVFSHGVPTRMAPMVFAGGVLGHLVGASVGREGAALQMAGSITDTTSRAMRLTDDERRTLIAASLAAGWAGVYGVPFTGVTFALAVTPKHRKAVLVPAIVAAAAGRFVVDLLGDDFAHRGRLPATHWTATLPFKLVALGVVVGLAAMLTVKVLQRIRAVMGHRIGWPPLRTVIGGAATVGLLVVFGRDYLGLSLPLMGEATSGASVEWWVPLLKALFTVVALGTGFVGGEVTPLLVIGATLGAAVAPGLGADRALFASLAMATVFTAAATVPVTGVVLTVEVFGWHAALPALIVGATARVVARRPGLYVHH